MNNSIAETLKESIISHQNKIDYLEIRVEQSEATSISFRGTQLDSVDRSLALAGGIRACHQGGWSFVTFNGLEELNDRISEAISQAKIVGKESTTLAPTEKVEDYVQVNFKKDPRQVSLQKNKD